MYKVAWLLSGPHASLHCHGPQEHLDISLPMAEVSKTAPERQDPLWIVIIGLS